MEAFPGPPGPPEPKQGPQALVLCGHNIILCGLSAIQIWQQAMVGCADAGKTVNLA